MCWCVQNIIDTNNGLREALHLGHQADKLLDSWDFLQVNCAMYINSDVPGLSQANQPNTKPLRRARTYDYKCTLHKCPF